MPPSSSSGASCAEKSAPKLAEWMEENVPQSFAVFHLPPTHRQSVCQPTTPKWRHTVERLKMQFPNWD
jgi:hypothetical protein